MPWNDFQLPFCRNSCVLYTSSAISIFSSKNVQNMFMGISPTGVASTNNTFSLKQFSVIWTTHNANPRHHRKLLPHLPAEQLQVTSFTWSLICEPTLFIFPEQFFCFFSWHCFKWNKTKISLALHFNKRFEQCLIYLIFSLG